MKNILLICGIILAISIWLLLHWRMQQKPALNLSANTTNQERSPTQINVAKIPQASSSSTLASVFSSAPTNLTLAEKTNLLKQGMLSLWQAPINFYGKVVDENTNPIADATIGFHWVEEPTEEGNRTATKTSDAEGLFSLQNALGLNLAVSVNKEGYYSSRKDNDSFTCGSLGGGGKFSPDAFNPVIFHLRKKGQGVELVTSQNGIRLNVAVRIPKDNTPVRLDFFQKQASANGQFEIKQIKPPWQNATNWSFSLSIPDGGLVENQDEFQFEAPKTGYQSTVEYNFSKDDADWTTHVAKQFYISFGNPRKYGWLRFESDISQETVFVTYAINPSGSRNLEPK